MAFALFVIAAAMYQMPVWLAPLSRYAGLPGEFDPLQSIWFLNWIPYALGHHLNPVVTDYINYPSGINLLWNTSTPALAVLMWPVTTHWGAIASYNVVTTSSLVLSCFFAYLAIRRWVARDSAAIVGAFVYGFSPFVLVQGLLHADVAASAALVPLALLLVDELIVRQRMRPWLLGALMAGFGILQFFIFEEFFVTEMIAAIVLTGVLAILSRHRIPVHLGYGLRASGVAVGLIGIVLAYPVIALQLGGPDRIAGAIHNPNSYVNDLAGLVVPTSHQLIAPPMIAAAGNDLGWWSEWSSYLGVPLLIVVGVTIWRNRGQTLVRVAALAAGVMLMFSLGPQLHVASLDTEVPLPWWVPAHLPILENVQPNRLIVYASLGASALAAIGFDRAWRRHVRGVPAVILVACALMANVPQIPSPTQMYSVPSAFGALPADAIPDAAVVLAVTCPCPSAIDALSWQSASQMRFKIVGGYFLGPPSPGQEKILAWASRLAGMPPRGHPATLQRLYLLAALRVMGVNEVILGPASGYNAAAQYLTDLLGPPAFAGGGIEIWRVQGLARASRYMPHSGVDSSMDLSERR